MEREQMPAGDTRASSSGKRDFRNERKRRARLH
jgi:hypothetical protein